MDTFSLLSEPVHEETEIMRKSEEIRITPRYRIRDEIAIMKNQDSEMI